MNSHVFIYSPERQSPLQRNLYGTITFIAWAVYFYLILPLLTLLLWGLGLRGTYVQLWLPESGLDPMLVINLPLIALGCALLLIGWAEYNRARFQGKDRRAQPVPVMAEHMAEELGVSPVLAAQLFNSRIATLKMDEAAALQEVQSVTRLALNVV